MRCEKCKYYKAWFSNDGDGNICEIIGLENFNTLDNCIWVNDDGSINQEEVDNCPI